MATRAALISSVLMDEDIGNITRHLRADDGSEKCTPDEARSLFRAESIKFSNEEVQAMAAYYSSAVGQKDQELARSLANQFSRGEPAQQSLLNVTNTATRPKVDQLVSLHRIGELFQSSGRPMPITASQMEAILAANYSSLSDSDLDSMIEFYNSPAGQKCANAARTAGASLLSHTRS